ncbi:nuclear factor of kappa light polypeptide gene enhancer in B-cells inhibitor, alpha b [Callorhinchus milii]|uniref:NF-kappa-B inhibitor alpha n=2 Tax=Callorhinchus milii TaxID=7868 RepID=A0A4W3GKK0_CALMI|nr:nuclear factor of kappa light polypeptide gene enhancer in B-cells inhibitor, alpha b [Callorhinchus milii]|eukprot:gi/632951859/ref/XP_007891530.1/ PREDICTED: NF-kappa-B inhibitor alpha [Callorhinchus milii]
MDNLYARDMDCDNCKGVVDQGKADYKSGSGLPWVAGKQTGAAEDRCDSGIGSMNEKDEEMLREIQELSLTDKRPGMAESAPCWRDFVSEDGDTFLHLAIIHGATDIVDQILKNTVEGDQYLSSQNYLKQTPLHLAVITDQPQLVRHLLWSGGDLGLRDVKGNTPLHIACEMNSSCVQAISECSTRLHIQSLLDNRNYNGLTCLHLAVKNRHYQMVNYLIQLGANINAQETSSGRTALHLAVEEQDADMVSLLLVCRADPNALMYNGCTAFHLTVGRDNHKIQMELMNVTDPSLLIMNEEDYLWEPESPEKELTFSYDDCVIGGHLLSC